MTPEVRRAALRAAAKTAFVATLVGCSGASKPATEAPPSNAAPPAAAAPVSCAAHLDGLATAKPKDLPASDPLHGRNDVFGAFTDVAARSAARTVECCKETLEKDGAQAKHRWECCSTFAINEQPFACTPWGPPCPPEMV